MTKENQAKLDHQHTKAVQRIRELEAKVFNLESELKVAKETISYYEYNQSLMKQQKERIHALENTNP